MTQGKQRATRYLHFLLPEQYADELPLAVAADFIACSLLMGFEALGLVSCGGCACQCIHAAGDVGFMTESEVGTDRVGAG